MSRLLLRGPEGERGSMPLLLLVTLVGMLLGALLVPMVINQDRTTRYATSRVQALDAAQAGVDVAVGRIRAALGGGTSSGGTPIGSSSLLPCVNDDQPPITGRVTGSGNGAYSVRIYYYTADPVQYPATPKMLCDPSAGTYDSVSGRTTPSYAEIDSTGTDGPAINGVTQGRTIVSYYVFRTSDVNISGGVIRIYPSSSTPTPYCMDAGSATPAVGTQITLAQCSTTFPPVPQQVFAYRQDLTIQLLSTVTSANPNGMCLDSAAPLTSGKPVTLQKCAALGSPIWHQQWSFNDSGHFEGSLGTSATTSPASAGGDNLANICINAANQNAGQQITVAKCTGSTAEPTQAWIPAPTVGAGQASGFRLQPPFTDYQLVNYGEFGRCMDITGQQVSYKYLIDYPCKQNPYPNAVTFNQKFSAVVRPDGKYWLRTFNTNDNNNAYCLTSTPAAGGYTYFDSCAPANTLQEFTLDPTTYNIRDYNGLCIGLTSPKDSDVWSAIANQTCTGAASQKWDANPSISVPTLQNTYERPVSSSPGS